MQDYAGPASVTLNGRPLIQNASVSVKRKSNASAVKTLPGGLVGKSKGAPDGMISLKNAVPAAGYEAKINDLIITQENVTIGVIMAGEEEIWEGWFETSDTASEVDQPIYQDCEFHGRRVTSHPV